MCCPSTSYMRFALVAASLVLAGCPSSAPAPSKQAPPAATSDSMSPPQAHERASSDSFATALVSHLSRKDPASRSTGDDFEAIHSSHYLPLAEGNSWTYKKSVPPGAAIAWWVVHRDLKHVSWITNNDAIPGTYEETYRVAKKVSGMLALWEVAVESNARATDTESGYARDGRYLRSESSYLASGGTVERILWGRVTSVEKAITILEMIDRKDPFSAEHWRQETILLIEPKEKKYEVTFKGYGPGPASGTIVDETVAVPAGTWNKVLRITTNWVNGFRTISYYASGVGLVKETQTNDQGKTQYILELKKYVIKE